MGWPKTLESSLAMIWHQIATLEAGRVVQIHSMGPDGKSLAFCAWAAVGMNSAIKAITARIRLTSDMILNPLCLQLRHKIIDFAHFD